MNGISDDLSRTTLFDSRRKKLCIEGCTWTFGITAFAKASITAPADSLGGMLVGLMEWTVRRRV
jgi:hypothetical protein